MVKTLHDLCLTYIQHHLDRIPNLHAGLPTVIKEILLERLAFHDLLTPDNFPHVKQHLLSPSLTTVNFYKCDQVNITLLELLAQSGCRLHVLNIYKCAHVGDAEVLMATQRQDELRVLELQKLPGLTVKGVHNIRSPKLWKVNLKMCTAMTTAGVAVVVQQNPSIKVLNLTDNNKVGSNVLLTIAEALGPSLEELYTEVHIPTDESLIALAKHCPNLRKLDLNGCMNIGKESLIELFQQCHKMESLDLSYCNRLRDWPDCEVLWTLPQTLQELSLCGVLLEDETIFVECLVRLKHIKSIRLCGVCALNDNTLTKILESIGAGLTHLDISGGIRYTLTDAGLAAVARHCTSLQALYLSLLNGITCITLTPMFESRRHALQFRKLYLSSRDMNPSVLRMVADSCFGLEELDLSGLTCVTNDLLLSLAANCPHLQRFSIKGCSKVTDEGVCELARCCPLKSVVLSGINNLTDKSVFALANSCHYLEEIYLNGCSHISPTALTYLTDCCIPRLYVQHKIPNAVPDQLMAKNLDTGEFCRADLLFPARRS